MTLRLKGQETEVKALRNGAPTDVTNAISNFEMTDELEVLEEDYLGETESRYDSIYKGTTFSLEVHLEDSAALDLRDEVLAKAQRRDGSATRFDIAFVLTPPNGITTVYTLIDVQFGPINISDSGRAEYVTMKFEGSCSKVGRSDF